MYSGNMFNGVANTMNNDEKNAWKNFAVLNSQPNTMATTTVKNQDT